jgi:hypothetical protein
VFTSQEGSLGEVSFLEVMAQVDRDLTTVDYFDRLLGLIKDLRRHSNATRKRGLLTVNSGFKVRLDLQADKPPVVVKGPFFPRVVNPRYRIRGTNV